MLKFLILGSAMIATLVSCSGSPEPIVPTRNDNKFEVTVEFKAPETITQVCSDLGVKYEADGCAAFYPDSKRCTIYVVEPKNMDDIDRFRIMGHEVLHCARGEYHK